ncbi:hypothetical protein J6590_025262 [Homalodisca vitripennis]|nr:hypothetical protein J6590_025262 [Homalodisca vitripennis]
MLGQVGLEMLALNRRDKQRRAKPTNPLRVEGTGNCICFNVFQRHSFWPARKSVHADKREHVETVRVVERKSPQVSKYLGLSSISSTPSTSYSESTVRFYRVPNKILSR